MKVFAIGAKYCQRPDEKTLRATCCTTKARDSIPFPATANCFAFQRSSYDIATSRIIAPFSIIARKVGAIKQIPERGFTHSYSRRADLNESCSLLDVTKWRILVANSDTFLDLKRAPLQQSSIFRGFLDREIARLESVQLAHTL